MKSLMLFALILGLSCTSCGEDDAIPRLACGPDIKIVDVIVDPTGDDFQLLEARITDLCLQVTIEATGCSSQGWRMELHTLGEVAESQPTQTSARLIFDDGVPAGDFTCQAQIVETYTFDLSPYLTPQTLPTRFSLDGSDAPLDIE
ncbi:hypothetical protein [Lewinella sp. JB7]|uniref:hypothetical protein n=1 Tax=Lewinella sp. JB7 TaxID=2962887 RepID=UPI0020C9BA58|nr:hypothetical protein [Lewinella sp. JB7]MCP9234869.1 hypothetical protein [Lewinella sp. JB7]